MAEGFLIFLYYNFVASIWTLVKNHIEHALTMYLVCCIYVNIYI